jgi:hypothetical protein
MPIAARNGHSTAPFAPERQSFLDNLPAGLGGETDQQMVPLTNRPASVHRRNILFSLLYASTAGGLPNGSLAYHQLGFAGWREMGREAMWVNERGMSAKETSGKRQEEENTRRHDTQRAPQSNQYGSGISTGTTNPCSARQAPYRRV